MLELVKTNNGMAVEKWIQMLTLRRGAVRRPWI
jgi:hypothetical protein